jgi:hypothetical protein
MNLYEQNDSLKPVCEFGRRAIDCKDWKWIDGMQAIVYGKDFHEEIGNIRVDDSVNPINSRAFSFVIARSVPDFNDPQTVECVLSLLRAVLNNDGVHLANEWSQSGERVVVCRYRRNKQKVWRVVGGRNAAEALTLVLENLNGN